MDSLIPKAVDAVLKQLDKDGMVFQSYKLSGNTFRAVLVLRFNCQKGYPWLEHGMGNAETSVAGSEGSVRSDAQDTSYMPMPEYYSRQVINGKISGVPCHDSGVDLNGSEPRDDERRRRRTMDTQTDMDMEYMRRLIDEFNAREYSPSVAPFSPNKRCSTVESDTMDSEMDTVRCRLRSDQECQTAHDDVFWARSTSKGVQTTEGSLRNYDPVRDTQRTEGLLDTISKAIQTVGYLEDFIHRAPDSRSILAFQSPPKEHRTVSIQTEPHECDACTQRLAHRDSIETLSANSDDLRVRLPPEYDDSDDSASESADHKVLVEHGSQTEPSRVLPQCNQVSPAALGILASRSTQSRLERKPRLTHAHSQTPTPSPVILMNGSCQTEDEIEQDRNTICHSFNPFQTFDDTSLTSSILTDNQMEPNSVEMTTMSIAVVSTGTDPHLSLGEVISPPQPTPLTLESSCQTEEQEEEVDFLSQLLSGKPPPKPLTPEVLCTCDASAQTAKCVMISRSAGIRVKQKDGSAQTSDDHNAPHGVTPQTTPVMEDDMEVTRSPLRIFKDTSLESKKLQRSATLDATRRKKKKKKKKTKSSAADYKNSKSTLEQLVTPSTSSSSTIQTVTRVYDDEDFRLFMDSLPSRHEPVISLQSGTALGAVQGVLRLRSGGQDLWVEALYLCIMPDVVVPLYCSGGKHKRCMPGQLIERRQADWERDYAVFKAKGSFESSNPGMEEFETAEQCCRATMGATPPASLGVSHGKGKRNSCASQ
ncbi:hypothetical protein CAPTEDRAFT_224142 [Capitella teleta]|uniref:Uncharacterized protein n=1 Tax=Capitella teleta TaxID=283909 RepID=R7TCB2_CAPTE|nr:hypothetical protein CAPTEDRAFT_224142 [Capitella teleta]|eukprot:ELT91353.1 hypothetical protein CAPTEDRAFT_224142 [Capitella teleta]